MNHRKAIPANGIRLSASATSSVLAASHAPDTCGSAGIALQSNPKLARVRAEKTTPAGGGLRGSQSGVGETVDLAHVVNSPGGCSNRQTHDSSNIIFELARDRISPGEHEGRRISPIASRL
jgi:hypothetical protein